MTPIVQNDRVLSADPAWRHNKLFLASLIFFLLLISVDYAPGQDRDEVIRVDTELAAFEVSVTDKSGKPVRNLSADDFRVFEDGKERKIDFFQPIKKQDDGRPLSIVFVLDVSGSMTTAEIERLRFAMQNFVERLADYNSYFAITAFAMEVKTLQSFTNRPDRLERSFDKLQRDQNGLSTHAYDAVDDAVRILRRKSPKQIKGRLPRRAVIIITDGFPVGDVVSPETVTERANIAETSVFAVILPSYSRVQGAKKPLMTPFESSGLIEKTGGMSLYATDKNFEPLFKTLAGEITASYAIAFYPDDESTRGKPHTVRIESKKGLAVRQNRTVYMVSQ